MENNNQNPNNDPVNTTVNETQSTTTSTQRVEPAVQYVEPVTQQTQTVQTHTEKLGARNIFGAIFGLIEILIGIRFVLKLLGANINSGFVQFINNITGFFVNLFKGIFAEVSIGSGSAVLEPASIIAFIIVALVAWLVLMLIARNNDKRTDKTSVTSNTRPENR